MAPLSMSRLRVLGGGPYGIAAVAVTFAVVEAIFRYLKNRNPFLAQLPFWPGTVILFLASAQYGLTRVIRFHPVCNPGYRTWLASTPWTNRKPLPFGPVELVWEDGLILGSMILLSATQPAPHAVELLCVFLVTHLLILTVTLWATGSKAIGYLTAFGLGGAVWLFHEPRACLVASIFLYLIAYEGLRRGLDRFPWEMSKLPKVQADSIVIRWEAEPCGWPFDPMLRDVRSDQGISRIDAVLCCALASWWLFALLSFVRNPDNRQSVLGIFFAASMLFPLARVAQYVSGYASPISFWGRLLTGRWIIPGYDQVFVGPICSPVSGLLSVIFLRIYNVSLETALPIAAGVTAVVALVAPPRLKHWRLTGKHRMVPVVGSKKSQADAQLIQVG
jgi:hypothetical protein